MRDACADFGTGLTEFNGEPSHVHLLVNFPPKVALSRLVNSLKGVSSRRLRQEFPGLARYYRRARFPLIVGSHPGVVAELHAHPARRRPLCAGQDVVLVGPSNREPGRELQQGRAELAHKPQWFQGRQEPVPRLIGQPLVDVLEVDPFLPGLSRGVPQVSGQCRHPGGVLGEQAERLDVEGEPLRRPVRPPRRAHPNLSHIPTA